MAMQTFSFMIPNGTAKRSPLTGLNIGTSDTQVKCVLLVDPGGMLLQGFSVNTADWSNSPTLTIDLYGPDGIKKITYVTGLAKSTPTYVWGGNEAITNGCYFLMTLSATPTAAGNVTIGLDSIGNR